MEYDGIVWSHSYPTVVSEISLDPESWYGHEHLVADNAPVFAGGFLRLGLFD